MSGAQQAGATMALPSTPDKKPSACDFDSMIRVNVGTGDQAKSYDMYKGVLRFYSGYFRKAIDNIESGRFAEAEQGMISLPEEEPKVFDLFKRWIYTRTFPSSPPETTSLEWQTILKLWIFGDRRDIPLLQNETLECFANWCDAKFITPTLHLNYVWENTNAGSPLRAYLVARICNRFHGSENLKAVPGRFSAEVMRDMLIYFFEKRPKYQESAVFAKVDKCQWHIHEVGVTCVKESPSTS